jgi:predicted nuclease of predicted toxin-antitoxin system
MDSRRVKFLLDENISRRILPALQQQFPGSTQVALLGMEQWDDRQLWEFAKANDFVIVTRDDDFRQLSQVLGFPPKVILLALGNCSNQRVLDALISAEELTRLLIDPDTGLVELY